MLSRLRPPDGSRLSGILILIVSAGIGAGAYLVVSDRLKDEPAPMVTPPGVVAVTPEVADAEPPKDDVRPPLKVKPLLAGGSAASFERMASSSGGEVGVAIAPLGRGSIREFGGLTSGHAWSVMKVPVLVTLLDERGGPDGLSSQEQAWARAALTQSDNDSAKALFAALEDSDGGLEGASDAIEQTLRKAGDESTEVNTAPNPSGFTTFGQTNWSATESTRFFRALARGCLLSGGGTDYVLGLMGEVVGDQRWGMGQTGIDGADLALKGGWGPEDGGPYLVRQSAIVGSGRRGYVISIVAQGSGSFESGVSVVNAAADWAADAADPRIKRPPAGCD